VSAGEPLAGRRVLVTRRPEQAGSLRQALEAAGAEVTVLPTLELAPPEDWAPLDTCLDSLAHYDWLLFTSPNAVDACLTRLRQRTAEVPASVNVAALGPTTAARLTEAGVRVKVTAAETTQEGLAAALPGLSLAGQRCLIPASDLARGDLAEILTTRGATVDQVVAYRTLPALDRATALNVQAEFDVVVFASPSAVSGLFAACGQDRARTLLTRATIACIGPTTARAIVAEGFAPPVVPDGPATVAGLVASLCRHFQARP
jgi:uroporphyrinogen-III synthase